jgi:hypothetical protein
MCFVVMLHEILIVLYLRNAEVAILWGRGGVTSGGLYIHVRSTGFVTKANPKEGTSGTVDLGPLFGGPEHAMFLEI